MKGVIVTMKYTTPEMDVVVLATDIIMASTNKGEFDDEEV